MRRSWVLVAVVAVVLGGRSAGAGDENRRGDEIVVAGRFHHTGTTVVTWMDPGGYDATRPPIHFGNRTKGLTPEVARRVRDGAGWDIETLRTVVDQFVIHYDVAGTSRRCFRVLQERALSVHFLLDLDGTIYQTLDLQEAAWHATIANGRSIGIEIANLGAYPVGGPDPFATWYATESDGRTRITIPGGPDRGVQRDPSAALRPARDAPVVGTVQGRALRQYDLTARQYASLVKLTATLCTLFPRITCDYPRDASGRLITAKLPDDVYQGYHGLLGHYHVQAEKIDPGPAFRWDEVVNEARALMARR